jgi:hypothetical protein
MKYLIQKGVAGLGNRMQALGRCVDLQRRTGAALWIDWRDFSWREGFESCFRLDNAESLTCEDALGQAWGDTYPIFWTPEKVADFKRWDGPYAEDRATKEPKTWDRSEENAIDQGRDTLVVCRYSAPYSDELFKRLHLSDAVLEAVRQERVVEDAIHIRHTDKKGEDPYKLIDGLSRPHRVCTDSVKAKAYAVEKGHVCTSVIANARGGWGVHHTDDADLAADGLTRRAINRGAVVDLVLCGLAKTFRTNCSNSSYAMLINRGRSAGWFSREAGQ